MSGRVEVKKKGLLGAQERLAEIMYCRLINVKGTES